MNSSHVILTPPASHVKHESFYLRLSVTEDLQSLTEKKEEMIEEQASEDISGGI